MRSNTPFPRNAGCIEQGAAPEEVLDKAMSLAVSAAANDADRFYRGNPFAELRAFLSLHLGVKRHETEPVTAVLASTSAESETAGSSSVLQWLAKQETQFLVTPAELAATHSLEPSEARTFDSGDAGRDC